MVQDGRRGGGAYLALVHVELLTEGGSVLFATPSKHMSCGLLLRDRGGAERHAPDERGPLAQRARCRCGTQREPNATDGAQEHPESKRRSRMQGPGRGAAAGTRGEKRQGRTPRAAFIACAGKGFVFRWLAISRGFDDDLDLEGTSCSKLEHPNWSKYSVNLGDDFDGRKVGLYLGRDDRDGRNAGPASPRREVNGPIT